VLAAQARVTELWARRAEVGGGTEPGRRRSAEMVRGGAVPVGIVLRGARRCAVRVAVRRCM